MVTIPIWIIGESRSGKTTYLIEQLQRFNDELTPSSQFTSPTVLIFAANSQNRIKLADQIWQTTAEKLAFRSTTPLGFFEDEVILFWPLLVESLNLRAQFPLRLRPETEQELAARLWSQELESGQLSHGRMNPDRKVRQTLDILQLAALSGVPLDDIPTILQQGLALPDAPEGLYTDIQELLIQWRSHCLEQGFLTYGIVCELYGQHLLHHPTYQQHLMRRYRVILADDVDEYPAITRSLFEVMLDHGVMGAFTYHPEGSVRLGLGADPEHLQALQQRCQTHILPSLSKAWSPSIKDWVEGNTTYIPDFSAIAAEMLTLRTTARGDLLRQTANVIIEAVKTNQIQPHEIAIIAPGLDAIARYTLRQLLAHAGIAVDSLQEQRPLISSPMVRALLTLLAFVYPDLGRWINREAVAEMLVILSHPISVTPTRDSAAPEQASERDWLLNDDLHQKLPFSSHPAIDPVRAGLLADHCYCPDPTQPQLLDITAFPRWDRLGYQATRAYQQIRQWIEIQNHQQQSRLLPSPVSLLDRAIQRFFIPTRILGVDQLAILRELMETALHYWEVESRLHPQATGNFSSTAIAEFIQLLQRGVVSANPYPVANIGVKSTAVTLATVFQYRAHRLSHRWHFWLDAGSAFWLGGGASELWAARLFLRQQLGQAWTTTDSQNADLDRLRRILLDLLSRVSDRLYLCHSDLAVNGTDQLGPLLPWVQTCTAVIPEAALTFPGSGDSNFLNF
ncbi:MAG: recombinase family protein [Microcoleaceae cyanobacterium]